MCIVLKIVVVPCFDLNFLSVVWCGFIFISIRRQWTKEETIAFLHAYADRAEEFGHARRRKFAMANVLEDLLAQGILVSNI